MTSAIGKLIRQFRLDTPLATGALGQTMRAQHVTTGEIVAIKIFHEHVSAGGAFAERFRSIVQAAADIRHPNVLPIRDFGEQDGQYFIIMDFIPTGSLRTLLSERDTRLPLRRALEVARQAAEGIAAAHARGVLHRDLKPENFLIEERGATDTVRVADFGLTRLAETGLTIDGSLGYGSLPYMSPEQLRGLPPDARSDMYSLGVVLYEITTGFPPFQVKNLGDALSKHASAEPPPPRSLSPGIPPGLEQILLRALSKDPAARVQTAGEFAALLRDEINKLPGQPLVVWRGTAVPAAGGHVIPKRDNGSPTPRKRFTLGAGEARNDDPTLPPPIEPKGEPRRVAPGPVTDSRRISVVLERETLMLVPGQPALLTVTLMNAGRTVDAFSLSVRGVAENWVQAPAQPQRLNPGQRAVVPLSVVVPRLPTSKAGTYSVTVVASSRENPGEENGAPATFVVQPFAQTTLSLVPPKARGWRKGEFAVAIANQGNCPAKYSLDGQDDERALGYALSATEVALEPGASLDVPLVTTSRLRPVGTADLRTFTVTAKPEFAGIASEPPKSVVGQFVHRAIIPLWLPPVVLAAAAAAFLFISKRNQLTLNVTPQAVQVSVGASAPVAATLTDAKNEAVTKGPPISWASRDTTVATVTQAGTIMGVHEGSTVVTARVGKRSQTVQVAVSAARVEEVAMTPKRVTLIVGGTAVLRAVAKDGGGHVLPRDPIWQSSDPTVVTVGGGRVTAKAAGVATITAQIESKTATADIQVNEPKIGDVKPVAEDCIAYDPASLSLNKDKVVGWRVTDGKGVLATLDREEEAKQVQALARRYRGRCFIGRANTRLNRSDYITDYWVAPTNVPSNIPKEDCREYDRASLTIKEIGAAGFSVEDRNGRLLLADSKTDAQKAWNIAKDHLAFCVIGRKNGRPNQRDYMVQYWR